jgi:hypothetical protein
MMAQTQQWIRKQGTSLVEWKERSQTPRAGACVNGVLAALFERIFGQLGGRQRV